jgi:hypothetical protein
MRGSFRNVRRINVTSTELAPWTLKMNAVKLIRSVFVRPELEVSFQMQPSLRSTYVSTRPADTRLTLGILGQFRVTQRHFPC